MSDNNDNNLKYYVLIHTVEYSKNEGSKVRAVKIDMSELYKMIDIFSEI